MNPVIETILTRKSVRDFSDREIGSLEQRTIIEAGMSGPSCVNARDWHFIVAEDCETLNLMADGNGGPAEPLRRAKLGILICGDTELAFSGAPDYWIIDGAIAAQNMIIAAESMGIGSVWLGTWPQMERVDAQRKLFGLPENIIPHSIIAFGYPKEPTERVIREHLQEEKVHIGKW